MGATSAIGWTDATWNPWQGCHKVSPGCKFCYMYRDKARYGQDPTVVVRSKPKTFEAPLSWGLPRRVFTCSWSDFFVEEADPWREDAMRIMLQTPQHTYQVLTKRPYEMAAWFDGRTVLHDICQGEGCNYCGDHAGRVPWRSYPWQNVMLGVSVESKTYLPRLDVLRSVPAWRRFVSFEPLLGDLGAMNLGGIHWAIIGGESGSEHRPMNPTWLARIIDECRQWSVPVFVKQDSGARPGQQGRIPDDLWIQEFPR